MAELFDDNEQKKKDLYRKMLAEEATAESTRKYSFPKFKERLSGDEVLLDKVSDIAVKKGWSSTKDDFYGTYFPELFTPQVAPAPKPQAAPAQQFPIGVAAPASIKGAAPSVTDIGREMAFEPAVQQPIEPVEPVGVMAPEPAQKPMPSVTEVARQMAFRPPVEPKMPKERKERGFGEWAGDVAGTIAAGGKRIGEGILSSLEYYVNGTLRAGLPEIEATESVQDIARNEMFKNAAQSQKRFQDEAAKRNIQTSVLQAIDKGQYKDIPEAVLYIVGDAAMQIIPSILTMGGSTYLQTLPQAYKDGVEAIAKEKGISPEQVIANGDDAMIIATISSGVQSALEFLGAGLVSKSMASRGAYKSMRDWLLSQGVNRNLARGAALLGVGVGEGTTEYLQEGTGQTGVIAAKSPTTKAFFEKLPKELFTPEAKRQRKEAFVGGLIGGAGVGGGGQVVQSAMDRTLFEAPKIGKATQRPDASVVMTDDKLIQRNNLNKAMESAIQANPEAEGQIRERYRKLNDALELTDDEVVSAYDGIAQLPDSKEKDAIRERLEQYMAEKDIQPEATGIEAGLGEGLRTTAPVIQTVNPDFPAPQPPVTEAPEEGTVPPVTEEDLSFLEETELTPEEEAALLAEEEAAPVAPAEEDMVLEEEVTPEAVPLEPVAPEAAPVEPVAPATEEVVSAAPVEEVAPEAPAAPAPKGKKKAPAPKEEVKEETPAVPEQERIKELEKEKSTLTTKALKQFPNSPAQLKTRKRIDEINTELAQLKKAEPAPVAEKEEGKKPAPKEGKGKVATKVEEYEGVFNPNKTGVAGIDELLTDDGYQFFYKGKKVERVLMSPDEYLERVRKGLKTKTDANILEGKTEAIKKAIESGAKINAPFISTVGGKFSQEGRNRAVVAKELGEQKIPVFIESDVTFDDKINRGADLVRQSQEKGNTTKESILEDIKKSGLHRDGVRFIEENYDAIQEKVGRPVAEKEEGKKPAPKEEKVDVKEKTTTFAADEKSRIQSERTGDRGGRYSSRGLAPLEGAPAKQGFHGPDPRLVEVAEKYARENGIPLIRQSEYVEVDVERAKRIAQAYEEMKHNPQNPAVKEAYQNLIKQTIAQYKALQDAGYKFYFIDLNTPEGQEYASTPWNALRDIRENKRMGVFSTEEGFGSNEDFNPEANPLLEETEFKWPLGEKGPLRRVLANDLFRAVHDAFGHGLEGAGFRARGEENAWQAHIRLFTGSAQGAITTETRGQNSWLNFGPFGEKNRTAKVEDTEFADQKTGLMPEWTWTEGRASDMPSFTSSQSSEAATAFDKAISASGRFRPKELVVFDTPIVGPNGNKLVAYQWAYEWTMKENKEGELVGKRISDWTQAESSAETGRDVVHKFTVQKTDGSTVTVSSETIPLLLGYVDAKQMKGLPSVVSAVKTLAKQRMQLAIMEAQEAEYKTLKEKFEKADKPEVKEVADPAAERFGINKEGEFTTYGMEDVSVRQDNKYNWNTKKFDKVPLSKETIEQLERKWVQKRIEEAGGKYPSNITDLRNRVKRQERRVEEATNSKITIKEQEGGRPSAEAKPPTPSFSSSQSTTIVADFDKAKTSKGFDKKHGKGAYKALSDITKNFEDIMDKVSDKIKQDCII